jgi:hypothetical protein
MALRERDRLADEHLRALVLGEAGDIERSAAEGIHP